MDPRVNPRIKSGDAGVTGEEDKPEKNAEQESPAVAKNDAAVVDL